MRDFNRTSRGGYGNKFNDRGNGRPEMHHAVCDDCGRDCEVPFKPTGNKEIFCSNCFDKRGGRDGRDNSRSFSRNDRSNNRFDESYGNRPGRGSSNFERRDNDREMFSAICDECGKDCKLPFKPSSNKPVYCSNCFDMRGERSGLVKGTPSKSGDTSKEIRELKDQMISLNVKMEKIIKALNIVEEKPVPAKTVKVSKADYIEATSEKEVATEKEAVKKAATKKTAKTEKKAVAKKKTTVKKTAAKKAKE